VLLGGHSESEVKLDYGKSGAKNAGQEERRRAEERVSELGRVLRKISDDYLASGGKQLNRRELEREIAERRGLR